MMICESSYSSRYLFPFLSLKTSLSSLRSSVTGSFLFSFRSPFVDQVFFFDFGLPSCVDGLSDWM